MASPGPLLSLYDVECVSRTFYISHGDYQSTLDILTLGETPMPYYFFRMTLPFCSLRNPVIVAVAGAGLPQPRVCVVEW
jgi:hypothetical protein